MVRTLAVLCLFVSGAANAVHLMNLVPMVREGAVLNAAEEKALAQLRLDGTRVVRVFKANPAALKARVVTVATTSRRGRFVATTPGRWAGPHGELALEAKNLTGRMTIDGRAYTIGTLGRFNFIAVKIP